MNKQKDFFFITGRANWLFVIESISVKEIPFLPTQLGPSKNMTIVYPMHVSI